MSDYPHLTYKKHTFLSALAMGFSAVLIALIICGTTIAIYSIHFAGEKTERLVSIAENAVRGLPELQKSLPPILADVLDDRRQPQYCNQLEITADTSYIQDRYGRLRTAIQIVNNGPEVVSLLSLRLVILDEHNEILAESNEWAATPIAVEDDWRGPLMPGSSRRFISYRGRNLPFSVIDDLKTEVEITDIRVWNGNKELPSGSTSETEISLSNAAELF
ncbi:MAG: hypothetical protein JW715_06140 [Sedimentisphaerales bacterium]|nr:hypothetical protein [Sedimentisphaerales bacterium]